jgi:hypothetical protein
MLTGALQVGNMQVVGGTTPSSTLGYIRNYKGHVDATSSYLISDPALNVPACAPFQMTKNEVGSGPDPASGATVEYPKLSANPGDTIMATYKENGHISKPNAPDAVVGPIYWFGTTSDEVPMLSEVMKWTADGKGGNGQGFAMGTPTSFDDGVCVEDNGTPIALSRQPAQDCRATFRIPESAEKGQTLTVFWVWDYSGHHGPHGPGGTAENPVPFTEWYTSCLDIDIGTGNVQTRSTGSVASNDSTAPNTSYKYPRDLVHRSAKFRAAL